MHARMACYSVPVDRLDEAVEGFRTAGEGLATLEGFAGGFLLTGDSGTLYTVTLWRDSRALEESATRAGAMRLRAIRDVDGTCESVRDFEVPLTFGAGRAAASLA